MDLPLILLESDPQLYALLGSWWSVKPMDGSNPCASTKSSSH